MKLAKTSAPSRGRVALAFAAVYIIWGSTYLAIRLAIETLPPFLMAGTRFLIAGTILYASLRGRGEPAPVRSDWKPALVIGGALLFIGNGGVVWAEQTVPSSVAALIISATPLWMTLIDSMRNRVRPGASVVIGLVIGFLGVAILIAPRALSSQADHVDPIGAGILLGASLAWASGSLYARGARFSGSALMGTALQNLSAGALFAGASLLLNERARLNPQNVSPVSMLAVGFLVVFGSIIAYSAYVWLLQVTTPARASTYAYVNPVVAVFLGWIFAGEPLTIQTLISAAIIIASVAMITARRRPARPAGAHAVAADNANSDWRKRDDRTQ